ncbi:MAG TPA: hypothetical protein VGH19_17010 [Verrucomicrobiae bacterium]
METSGQEDTKTPQRLGGIFKRAVFLLASACWVLIGLGFGMCLIQYMFHRGAGIHILGIPISSASVLIGVIHFTGFSMGMLFSLALGIWLGALGVSGDHHQK